jgi:hypothetical protein
MPRASSAVRKPILDQAQTNVLTKCRRRCCLCFWLDSIDDVVQGQFAHLDKNPAHSEEDNLAFLCLRHHDDYDSIPRLSKGLREKEVRHWRDELTREMAFRFRKYSSVTVRRKSDFDYLEGVMKDLLLMMRAQLKEKPLARLIILVGSGERVTSPWQFLSLSYRDCPQLRDKVRILHNFGLVQHEGDEGDSYWLTEEMATYLGQA